jgi:chorismate mutase / prephenate dehydratase
MSKTVDEIRKTIDTMDNTIHDLLMQRAELVLKIGEEKRKNNVQVVQPDREIIMLRRLLARHKGPLPKEAVVRIWRELVGAVSLLQTGLKVVVTVPDDATGLIYWDMAKDYFSSVLPMSKAANPLAALAMVREGEATFAIVPRPADGDANPWWKFLLDESGDKPMRIVARLPLGDRSRADANPQHQAFVVARLKFETSGDDRSFIILEVEQSISRAKIVDKIKEAGLETRSFNTCNGKSGSRTLHLIEVDKYLGPEDERLARILEKLDSAGSRAVAAGGYPAPPVYEDKVGKNAEAAATEAKSPAKKSAQS